VLIPGFGVVTRLVGVCGFGLGLLAALAEGGTRRLHLAHYFMGGFALWSCASYFWSIAPEETAQRASTYVQLVGMGWLIWQLAIDKRRIHSLLNAYVLGVSVCVAGVFANYLSDRTSLVMQMAPPETAAYDAARYTISGLNENDLGMLLALSIPMAWYLSVEQKSQLRSFLYWLQISCASAGIVLTGSRASVIVAGLALLASPLAFRRRRPKAILGLLATGVLAITLALSFMPIASWGRIDTIRGELLEGTMSKRTIIWGAAMQVFPEHPLSGIGSGTFGLRIAEVIGIPFAAHNTFLSVLVELGLVGAVLLIVLLIALGFSVSASPYSTKLLWGVLLVCWIVGVSTLSWEYKKATWFLFAMAPAHAALEDTRKRLRGASTGVRCRDGSDDGCGQYPPA
jgi:hypothetical protein